MQETGLLRAKFSIREVATEKVLKAYGKVIEKTNELGDVVSLA